MSLKKVLKAIFVHGPKKVYSWLVGSKKPASVLKGKGGAKSTLLPGGATVTAIPKDDPIHEYMEKEGISADMVEGLFKTLESEGANIEDIVSGREQLFGPQQDLDLAQLDFGPIEEQARKQFKERTIPTLMERFTALGHEAPSGALNRQMAQAGVDLESALAAQRAEVQPKFALSKALLELQQRGQRVSETGAVTQALESPQRMQLSKAQLLANILGAPASHLAAEPRKPSFWESRMAGQLTKVGGKALGNYLGWNK